MAATRNAVLGLDVGDKRIGIATASLDSRLPRPLKTLNRDDKFFAALDGLIDTEGAGQLVVGLPRNLSGRDTAQTEATRTFVAELRRHCNLPIHMQDEAATSRQAEAELKARGKAYNREDIDALAATYILEDFLAGNEGSA